MLAITAPILTSLPLLAQLTDYMDRTWINGTFKPEMWNVFDSNGPHTSNHLEGWPGPAGGWGLCPT